MISTCIIDHRHAIMQRIPRPKVALTSRLPIIQSSLRTHRTWLKKERVVLRRSTASGTSSPTSSRGAVEEGLKLFQKKSYAEAVEHFNTALELNPTDDEAMAALYNLGCAYTKQKQWKLASESIIRAINDYKLKLSVALKDEDLKELRDRREWIDALTEIKGGLSRDMKIDLRSEAKAPFRLTRMFVVGGFAFGAALGLFITTSRLILAFRGGEGAPDMTESLTNFGINSGVLALAGVLLYRDSKAKERSLEVTDREELLSRLQIDLGTGRVLPLIRFRGQVRPVILAGSKQFVDRAVRAADPYMIKLRERGVSVVPLVLSNNPSATGKQQSDDLDPDAKILALKKEFQRKDSSKGFGGSKTERADESPSKLASDDPVSGISEGDRKWKLTPFDTDEWQGWVQQQKQFAGLSGEDRNCFIQVQLDGTVRTSSLGTPNWGKLVDDLPPLNDIRTSFSDGVGTSV